MSNNSKSKKNVVFQWIYNPRNERLKNSQTQLEKSIRAFGLEPLRYPAGPRLTPFGELLKFARKQTLSNAFVWCNSDVVLTRNPFDVPNCNQVYGFHRREVPSGNFGCGVDMYYIPVKLWDECLSLDIPKLYLGASYVDWWISRGMQNLGLYENLFGYIDHESHPRSAASGSDDNLYYQKNFCAYNAWAKRNSLSSIPAPPYLIPYLGHSWGIRDAIQKLVSKLHKNGN